VVMLGCSSGIMVPTLETDGLLRVPVANVLAKVPVADVVPDVVVVVVVPDVVVVVVADVVLVVVVAKRRPKERAPQKGKSILRPELVPIHAPVATKRLWTRQHAKKHSSH